MDMAPNCEYCTVRRYTKYAGLADASYMLHINIGIKVTKEIEMNKNFPKNGKDFVSACMHIVIIIISCNIIYECDVYKLRALYVVRALYARNYFYTDFFNSFLLLLCTSMMNVQYV